MFAAIDERMTAYLQAHLRLDRAQADGLRRDYWRRYGATLLGLVRHHGVDARHFLHATHDFDVGARLLAEPGLPAWGRSLAGRKVLLTNAPAHYAGRVLRGIGLHPHFDRRYAIEDMRVHGHFRPKPSRSMLRSVLARERLPGRTGARRVVLVDDSPANLKAARAVGFATVLVERRGGGRGGRRLAGAGYIDARVRSVRALAALAPRLGRRLRAATE
jgi:putative hydrolase of the HAD superfamily